MSIETLKRELHVRIEEADEQLLRLFYAVSKAYKADRGVSEQDILNALPPPGPVLTVEEFLLELQLAEEQIEAGDFITLEDLEQEMANW